LVGHTELASTRTLPGLRVGDFEATDVGERLMPIILGVGPALRIFYDFATAAREQAEASGVKVARDEWPDAVRTSTEYADAISSQDELDSLALELHDKTGKLVKTDWIHIKDMHQLVAWSREQMVKDAEEMGLEIEFDDPEPWEPELPKYQIMVMLEGGEKRLERQAAKRLRKSSRDPEVP
jgi:hypothetical protein